MNRLTDLVRASLTTLVVCATLASPAVAGGNGPTSGLNSWLETAFLVDNGQQGVANCQDQLVFSLFFALGTSGGHADSAPKQGVRLTIPRPGPTSPTGNGLWITASTTNPHGSCVIDPYSASSSEISAVCDVGDNDPGTWNEDYAVLHASFVAVATDDPMIVTGVARVPTGGGGFDVAADPVSIETTPCSGGGGTGVDMSLVKSDGGISTVPGGIVPYTLQAQNVGTLVATGVQLRENVPAQTTFVASASSAGWSCADGSPPGTLCVLNLGTIAVGAGRTRTFAVQAAPSFSLAQISNTAVVLVSGDTNGANNTATDTTPVGQPGPPDLQLAKSDGGISTVPGGIVAYTLSTQNVGEQGATGVILSETVPLHTTFAAGSSSPGWSCPNGALAGTACSLAIGSVAIGGSAARTFAVQVTSPLPAGVTQISNTASVADDGAGGADPTPANNTATDTTPINAGGLEVDLAVGKTDGGISALPGDVVSYSLTYSNLGNVGATGVQLTETVPLHTTFSAGSSSPGWSCPNGSPAGTVCTLAIGGLAGGGASGSRTFAVLVADPLDGDVLQITNTVTISGNEPDATPANNSATDTTPIPPGALVVDLEATKTALVEEVGAGDLIEYQLTVCNSGNANATGVILSETVPLHTTFSSASSSPGWSCAHGSPAGTLCTISLGTVAPGFCGAVGATSPSKMKADRIQATANLGGPITRVFAVRVVDPIPSGVETIANTVVVSGDQEDDDPGDDSDDEDTPVEELVDLGVSKSDGGATAVPGGGVAYTLIVTNNGRRSATGVVLTETVPLHTTFVAGSSSAGWSCANGAPAGSSCSLAIGGLLGAGGSTSRVFALAVVDPLPGGVTEISNTASVADDGINGPDANLADNTASDTTPINAGGLEVDLALGKDDGGVSTFPGEVVAYTITYSNSGNVEATGVVLSETVPAHTTFAAGSSTAGWSCPNGSPAGTTCSLAVGSVAGGGAGGSATFAVTVGNVPAGVTQITNTASVADDGAGGPDPTPGNNTATDTTPLDASGTGFDLWVTKDDGGTSALPGDVVSYSLTYGNAGNQEVLNVVLTETVPAECTFVASGSSVWSCGQGAPAGSVCTLAVGAVGAGSSGNATFVVALADPATISLVVNTVTIDGDGTDLDPSNNVATDTTPVIAEGDDELDASVSKDDGGESVYAGDVILYSLGWSVAGEGSSRVLLTETVPLHTTFVAAASSVGWSCVDGAIAGSLCMWESPGPVSAGEQGSVMFGVTVDADLEEGVSVIANAVRVDLLNALDIDESNNEASTETPVLGDGGGGPGDPDPVDIPVNAPLALLLMSLALLASATVVLRR